MSDRPRRPAFRTPWQLDQQVGGSDPADAVELSHTTAQVLVHRGRAADDPEVTRRLVELVDDLGLDALARGRLQRSTTEWLLVALALAARGLGNVWPNPAVGCVIVHDGRVVGRGRNIAFLEAELFDDAGVLLINALDRDTFAAGHIPGSVNVPFGELVDERGTLKDVPALRAIFDAVGALDDSVRPVTYCGGGIAATAAAFALAAVGRDDASVYDGSMNAWTSDPSRPLAPS